MNLDMPGLDRTTVTLCRVTFLPASPSEQNPDCEPVITEHHKAEGFTEAGVLGLAGEIYSTSESFKPVSSGLELFLRDENDCSYELTNRGNQGDWVFQAEKAELV